MASDAKGTAVRLPWWRRPPWRTLILLLALMSPFVLAYAVWSPGRSVRDGAHDRGENGIWLQHSWLADDAWCEENDRVERCRRLRDPEEIESQFAQLQSAGIRYLFPHLAPTSGSGSLPGVDRAQLVRVLDAAERHDLLVIPWIGGVWQRHVFPEDPAWRRRFVADVVSLLALDARIAGVQINVEPLTNGDEDFVELLGELRGSMPDDRILGLAAYPPAPFARSDDDVFWTLDYLRELSEPVDQISMMLYDTGYPLRKFYVAAVAGWTRDVLRADLAADILLGVPAYDDHGVPWHDPRVENVRSGLRGIHAGLRDFGDLPENYRGIAIYSEWEMEPDEWSAIERRFTAR